MTEDVKAAQVARKLQNTPKSDRAAQIQYERDGTTYYKGVYGSFDNAESAQKALDSLPSEIKQGAVVKKWESISR